ncbi:MAG: hypothetical protein RBU21_17060 [FCB group bacterium]|nr:hypothetical protein [FCB group bacterium]
MFAEIGIGARALQGMFLALNILLLAMLSWRLFDAASRAASVTILGFIALLALQPSIWGVHLQLWTEPAFLVLCLADILVMERALRDSAPWKWLAVGALVAGFAVLVRYAGLFLIATNVLAILVLAASWSLRDRLAKTVFVGIVSATPLLAWLAFNHLRGAGTEVRSLVYHPLSESHIREALETVSGWFGLGANLGWVLMLLVLLVTLIPWFLRRHTPDSLIAARLLSIYTLSYVAFIVLSISWADAHTPLDARILVPIFPSVFLLALHAFWPIRWKWARALGVLLLAVPLLLNLPSSYALWKTSFRDGTGFGSRVVQQMPALEFIRSLPPTWSTGTNTPEIFQLYLEQQATMFPRSTDPITRTENPEYQEELAQMATRADLLVYFAAGGYRWYLPSTEELSALDGFTLVYAQSDAAIWARSEHVRMAE